MAYAKPTEAQREGVSATFRRAYNSKAQAAARKKWVLESELTAEQLIEARDRRIADTAAREAARRERAA